MPVYGNINDVNQLDAVIGTTGLLPVQSTGGIWAEAFPVTFDVTQSPFAQQYNAEHFTLHDIVAGQEWKLLRVVGKVHAGFASGVGGSDPTYIGPPAAEFAAALIVGRTNEEGQLEMDLNEHNPLEMEGADDPWIWRRKWILGNASYVNNANNPFVQSSIEWMQWNIGTKGYPFCTSGYGSVADGPHVDQKTRRRISREERLFWVLASRMWDPAGLMTSELNTPGTIFYNIDNRFVGRLSSRMGNRNNASR